MNTLNKRKEVGTNRIHILIIVIVFLIQLLLMYVEYINLDETHFINDMSTIDVHLFLFGEGDSTIWFSGLLNNFIVYTVVQIVMISCIFSLRKGLSKKRWDVNILLIMWLILLVVNVVSKLILASHQFVFLPMIPYKIFMSLQFTYFIHPIIDLVVMLFFVLFIYCHLKVVINQWRKN